MKDVYYELTVHNSNLLEDYMNEHKVERRWLVDGIFKVVENILCFDYRLKDTLLVCGGRLTQDQLTNLFSAGLLAKEFDPEDEFVHEIVCYLADKMSDAIKKEYGVSDRLYAMINELQQQIYINEAFTS